MADQLCIYHVDLNFVNIRPEALRKWLQVDGAPFIEAVDRISGMSLPFGQGHSTAVQWNGLKNSMPAPEAYIRKLLAEWGADGRLEKERQAIDDKIAAIVGGLTGLAAFGPSAARSLDLLRTWMRAAHLQPWQAQAVREILHGRRSPEIAGLLQALKAEFEQLLSLEQTPASAAKNAALAHAY